jgi:NAD(P)-dependent dehydrogenase (short-subunit alcohol dehydrogenase family)
VASPHSHRPSPGAALGDRTSAPPVAVVAGGTDGIGRALAATYLERGHHVLVVGRNATKGRAFLDAAARSGAADRAGFLAADLSLVAENERAVARIAAEHPRVDVLVLGARFHRSTRAETADGFEDNFALFYLSRFLFSHGLVGSLRRAPAPVVLNFGGAGLTGPVRWDDLQLTRGYPGTGALGHAAALCDLLAVSFTDIHADAGISYVLDHPGVVATSFSGEYDPATAAHVEQLKAGGKPVGAAIGQILPFLDDPPARLTAVHEGRQVRTDTAAFDPADARRLHELTEALLARRAAADPERTSP